MNEITYTCTITATSWRVELQTRFNSHCDYLKPEIKPEIKPSDNDTTNTCITLIKSSQEKEHKVMQTLTKTKNKNVSLDAYTGESSSPLLLSASCKMGRLYTRARNQCPLKRKKKTGEGMFQKLITLQQFVAI